MQIELACEHHVMQKEIAGDRSARHTVLCTSMLSFLLFCQSRLGLHLGLEAPVMTPNGVIFLFSLQCSEICLQIRWHGCMAGSR